LDLLIWSWMTAGIPMSNKYPPSTTAFPMSKMEE
jgi:hypothetical protein